MTASGNGGWMLFSADQAVVLRTVEWTAEGGKEQETGEDGRQSLWMGGCEDLTGKREEKWDDGLGGCLTGWVDSALDEDYDFAPPRYRSHPCSQVTGGCLT
jgi:hypothetical protein